MGTLVQQQYIDQLYLWEIQKPLENKDSNLDQYGSLCQGHCPSTTFSPNPNQDRGIRLIKSQIPNFCWRKKYLDYASNVSTYAGATEGLDSVSQVSESWPSQEYSESTRCLRTTCTSKHTHVRATPPSSVRLNWQDFQSLAYLWGEKEKTET